MNSYLDQYPDDVTDRQCHGCLKATPSWALYDVATPDHEGERWICGACIIDAEREAMIAPALTMKDVRGERNALLSLSDWSQGRDISDEIAEHWAPVREALRQLPEVHSDPEDAMAVLLLIKGEHFTRADLGE